MKMGPKRKKQIVKYLSIIITWLVTSGSLAYLTLTFVLPVKLFHETIGALNNNGKYSEAQALAERYEHMLPDFLLVRISQSLLLERAKSELGLKMYESAIDTLSRIKSSLSDSRSRDDYYMTMARIELGRAERAKSKSEMDSYYKFIENAKENFEKLDAPHELGTLAVVTRMDLYNNLGHVAIEGNSANQGESSANYVKARKSAALLEDNTDTQFLNEYIESLNGQARLEMETKRPDSLKSSIDTLRLVNTISEDFGFDEHARYSCNELGVAYYQLEELDLSEQWLGKAQEKAKNQLRDLKIGDANIDKKRWIEANLSTTMQSLASVMIRRGRYKAAVEVLKEILTHESDTQVRTTTSLKLAQAYLIDNDLRDLDTARTYLNAANGLLKSGDGRNYDQAAIELWYGHLAYTAGDFEGAKSRYEGAKIMYDNISQTGTLEYESVLRGVKGLAPVFLTP